MERAEATVLEKPKGKTPQILLEFLSSGESTPVFSKWIELTKSLADVEKEIAKLTCVIPNYVGWTLYDEANFETFSPWEDISLETFHGVASLIVDHPFLGTAVMGEFDCDFCEARMRIDQDLLGCYESLAEAYNSLCWGMYGKAVSLLYEGYMALDHYSDMGGVWEINGDIDVIYSDTAVYVFRGSRVYFE